MPVVTMKDLLESGVHFGHQTRRWNPKMRPYIFTERNGIYILDLQRTLRELDAAYRFVRDINARGGSVLFVGTKKQAQDPVRSEAERSGQPYVNQRWLGGMLTNYVTMRGRVNRMRELEAMEESGELALRPKKEATQLRTEFDKLNKNLSGIREMNDLPQAVFVIDTKREHIAVAEARRLGIPLIGLVDTNADPDEVDYVIPGNDDAIRSVGLICRIMAEAAIAGRGAAGIEIAAPVAAPAEVVPAEVVPADEVTAEPAPVFDDVEAADVDAPAAGDEAAVETTPDETVDEA
jgi:small subunit ribosomal protein S2